MGFNAAVHFAPRTVTNLSQTVNPTVQVPNYFGRLGAAAVPPPAGAPEAYGAFSDLFVYDAGGGVLAAGSYIIEADVSLFVFGTDPGEIGPQVDVAMFVDDVQIDQSIPYAIIATPGVGYGTVLLGIGGYAGFKKALTNATHTFKLRWRGLGVTPAMSVTCDPTTPGSGHATISITRVLP